MPNETWLVVATAILSSSVVGTVVSWWKDRKVTAATVEVSGVSALSEALSALRGELDQTRHDLHETRDEVCRLRSENVTLGAQIRHLETKLATYEGRQV